MPRRAKGPRLYLDRARDQWAILDGKKFVRTGCARSAIESAEKFLAEFIASKYKPKASASPMIGDVLLVFSKERVPSMRSARNVAYNISNLKKWWGDKSAADVSPRTCRAYSATRSPSAARVDLKVLRSALNYWHAEYGPLASLPRIWQPPEPTPRERWLTKSEAARLLWASRRNRHLARFILLGLYTGSRPGVIVTLRWDWIDFASGIMLRRAPGERDVAQKRRPPVKLGRKILGHLKRWRRLEQNEPSGFVPAPWIVHYDGRPIKEPHSAWAQAIKAAGLRGVTPHTLRHTRATWLMQAGVSPWQAAGALGMSVRVLEHVYGHHHPAYGQEAAEV